MHIPGAMANLMSTNSIVLSECSIEIGMMNDRFYCIMNCHRNVDINRKIDIHSTKRIEKQIEAIRVNELWWITKTQMFDILLRGGWSVEEEQQFQVDYDRRYGAYMMEVTMQQLG